jgi:3-deoxy-D-manno-octulosonic acid kinase
MRADARPWIEPLLVAVPADCAGYPRRPLGAGRGGAAVVRANGHEVAVRHARRGGLPARFLRDLYFGASPRPFREVHVTETLRARGAPVVEAFGAVASWVVPGVYRGWLATAYVPESCTLWEWAQREPNTAEREEVLRAAGAAVRQLHACGARHPDLNLNNVLVLARDSSAEARVLLIDFDRARLRRPSLRGAYADLLRLRRSARKLDPAGNVVTDADLRLLEEAYHASG